ncbi:MAG: DMT family transporter [Glaciecola sp.]
MIARLRPFFPILFLCFWSAGYATAKAALEYTLPLNLLAYRFIGAFLLLTPIVLYLKLRVPNWSQIKGLVLTSLFLHVGHFGSIYMGLKLGASASIMALLAASQPVLVIIAASLLTRKVPSWQVWISLTLGLTGAAIILGVDLKGGSNYVLGALLGFVAVVGLSIGQVIEKQRKAGVHPISATWIQYGFASLISIPLALLAEGLTYTMSLTLVLSTGYLIIGNSIIGIMMMLSMVRSGSVSQVASIMFMVPAIGALIAWPVAGEVPQLIMLPGFALAMIGAIWTSRLSNKDK